MRLDRFLTLHVFGPLVKGANSRERFRIPILMYHSISDDFENGIHPYYRINTSPKMFSEHMRYLHESGCQVISLSAAVDLIKQANNCPSPYTLCPMSRRVVLTFDDGYRDFYTHAFHILRKYGFSATVFLPTGFIENAKNQGLKGKYHLTWDEVKELANQGITFGSHTVTHRQLRIFGRAEIEYEIRKSKEVIEGNLGQNVVSFSYPYKFMEQDSEFVKTLKTILSNAGYENAVSTRIGTVNTTNDIFSLRRIPVNSGDQASLFKAKLEGGYDWLYLMQYANKYLRIQIL